jgi:hypothetical protein
MQRSLQRVALILRGHSFASLRAPMLTTARWSSIALALAVILPILLLSTRRSPVRAGTLEEPSQSLELTLTGEGGRLSVGWDREAPVIQAGQCGVLWVADGAVHRRVVLDARQLRAGKLFYWPVNRDVSFELKIFGASNGGGELCNNSRLLLQPPRSAQPTQQAEFPVSRSRRSTVRSEEAGGYRKFALVPPRKAPTSRIEMLDSPPAAALAARAPVDEQILAAVGGPLLPGAPPPFATVTMEGATGSRRRTRDMVPPKLFREDIPAVPIELHRNLKEETTIDVRVFVNERGKVRYAELLSDLATVDPSLASLAVFNARRWEFIPARLEGHIVPGEAILHYRFGNPLLATSRDRP